MLGIIRRRPLYITSTQNLKRSISIGRGLEFSKAKLILVVHSHAIKSVWK